MADEFLPDLEVAYIANHNTVAPHGYNLTHGGGRGGRLSAETKRKISEAHKGKIVYADTKRKLSELNKGEKPPNFGKKRDAEAIRKTAEANRGKKRSAETKRKISGALKGRKRSKEHCRNLSKSLSGEKPPQFGKPIPADIRRKISEAQKGEKNHFFCKKHSAKTRERMSQSQKGKKLHPDYNRVHTFYFQLPKDMPISEKRRCVLCEFPNSANPARVTLYKWIRQWESNRETIR